MVNALSDRNQPILLLTDARDGGANRAAIIMLAQAMTERGLNAVLAEGDLSVDQAVRPFRNPQVVATPRIRPRPLRAAARDVTTLRDDPLAAIAAALNPRRRIVPDYAQDLRKLLNAIKPKRILASFPWSACSLIVARKTLRDQIPFAVLDGGFFTPASAYDLSPIDRAFAVAADDERAARFHDERRRKRSRRIAQRIAENALAILVPSKQAENDLVTDVPAAKRVVVTIPPPLIGPRDENAAPQTLHAARRVAPGRLVIAAVDVAARRAALNAAEALAEIRRYGVSAALVLSEDQRHAANALDVLAENRILNRINTPPIPNPARPLIDIRCLPDWTPYDGNVPQAACLVVDAPHPSHPALAARAMLHGIHVVAVDRDAAFAPRDLIQDDAFGTLAPPDDPDALADAALNAAERPKIPAIIRDRALELSAKRLLPKYLKAMDL